MEVLMLLFALWSWTGFVDDSTAVVPGESGQVSAADGGHPPPPPKP